MKELTAQLEAATDEWRRDRQYEQLHKEMLTILDRPDEAASWRRSSHSEGLQKRHLTRRREVDGQITELGTIRDASSTTVTLSRAPRPTVARIFTETRAVTSVAGLTEHMTRAAFNAAGNGWFKDGAYTWVRADAGVTELKLNH